MVDADDGAGFEEVVSGARRDRRRRSVSGVEHLRRLGVWSVPM